MSTRTTNTSPASLITLAASLSRRVAAAAVHLIEAAGPAGRGVWSRPGRHHIEVRGVCEPGSERLARQVERALEKIPGVSWARVNAPSGRVVVAVGPPEPPLRDLIATIAAVERDSDHEPDPEAPAPHPPEEGPRTRRAMSTLAADALGLTMSVANRILPFTPIPSEFAGFLTAVDMHPKLHALAGRGLRGDHRADIVFPLAEALVQGLTGGWASILLDGAQRVVQWQEARAQLSAWTKAEPRLTGTPESAAAPPPAAQRPCPKPDGPVERYIGKAINTGAAIATAATPVLGVKRATALGLATMPKAPAAGREGYAAHLGRVLARQGVIAMDRAVLRDLDRIDTVLLDAAILTSNRGTLTELVSLTEVDAEEATIRAFGLFDPSQPEALRHADGWRLGLIEQLGLRHPHDSSEAQRLRRDGGRLLGLAEGDRLAALVRVEAEPAVGADSLATAARRAGLRLAVAGDDDPQRYGFADVTVPGGAHIAESVRALQIDGAMVLLVSANRAALAAADCGLGIAGPDDPPPWGAHLLVGADLRTAAMVIEAAGVARRMVRQGIGLATAGTGLAAIAAFTAKPRQLPNRAMAAVNSVAALAFAHGVWAAHQLHDRPISPPRMNTAWHLMPVKAVLDRLETGPQGLTTEEASRRRTDAGAEARGTSLLRAFIDELSNPLTPVLAAGAALSATFGSLVDAGLVGGVVGASALVGAAHQVRTEHSLAQLLARSAVNARVRRDGVEQMLAAENLVPGDIVILESGDSVPADCRIVESAGLEADESSLTGESLPVAKAAQPVVAAAVAERRSMLYEGTTVAAGKAIAVVVATGPDTETGRGMALARQVPPASGVEAKLGRLTRTAIPLAAGSAVAVAGAGLLRGVPLAETAATAANLAVASVPEGLPFLVGAAQLAAARRLAAHGALVRNPRTIETLGRVDVLCFDKTGTLTEGQLRLSGVGDSGRYVPADRLDGVLARVLAAALRATPQANQPEQLKQQTDRAVLLGAQRAGISVDTAASGWRAVGGLPFEPSRGYHATIGDMGDHLVLSVKGAPETVLPRCGAYRTGTGEQTLDERGRKRLAQRLTRHAKDGHRVLAVAEQTIDHDQLTDGDVQGLVFVGFLALADAVRKNAAPSVGQIRAAGVHTIMITGDHPATAAAIASIISTDSEEQRVVTASELDDLDEEALADRLSRTDVVARCTPIHKVRIIQALQKCGRTVAMTGDGANDAPAIRLADVGIALGQRGTPAARAAADLVVTDDRLETIIATLIEGRAMWSSVRHGLSILVGGNLGEIAFSVLSASVTGRSALTGRQLLLVNLLTDLVPAMAIAVRPPQDNATANLLAEGPEASLGTSLSREIGLRAAATTLGATAGWTLARYTGRRRRAGTITLASLVGTQLGQTLVAGGAGPMVLASTAVSAGVLVAVVQTPGISHFFGCTPLGPIGWGIATGSALGATLGTSALSHLISPRSCT